ncbi:MAG: hypothetical protein WCT39_05225 [Candidatus Margulisiibacteriota bacterium]
MEINALGGFKVLMDIGQTGEKPIKDGEYSDRLVNVITKDGKNKAEYVSIRIVIEKGEIETAAFFINEYMEDGVPREYALYANNDGLVTTNVENRFKTPKEARERLMGYLEGILKRSDLSPTSRSICEFVLRKITPQQ